MSLTHTADELINRAAAILGKYVPGEALGAIEQDTINRCIDDVLAEVQRIVVIDKSAISNIYFETIARLVAIYAASDFSNTPLDLTAVNAHEFRLRVLVSQNPTYEVLGVNYF